jgi:hypothetical protein
VLTSALVQFDANGERLRKCNRRENMTKAELKSLRVALKDKTAELRSGISAWREALAIETGSDELDQIQNAPPVGMRSR